MRKLFPLLLLAGLALPLTGCGKDEPKKEDAKEKVEGAAGTAGTPADKHGTGTGSQDHSGDGGAKGGGKKHE
jgi:hypothetical protein